MKHSTPSFRGMAPRVTPRALPENASQKAVNARLLSGDLEPWNRPALLATLANAGTVKSIFLLDDVWLSYEEEVEFARGTILGDETFTTYITGLDAPRWTNKALATSGPPPYPVETRLLGVPGPQDEPIVQVELAPPDESNIEMVNSGAESGSTTGWTITTGGMVALETGDVAGLEPRLGSFYFGGGVTATSEAFQSVDTGSLAIVSGQGITLTWWQACGADQSTAGMTLRFFDANDQPLPEVTSGQSAPTTTFAWEQRTLSTQVPEGAVRVDVVQQYTRVGLGTNLDAYIDGIALNAIAYTNSFDGSSLVGWTASPNNGDTLDDKHRFIVIDDTHGWPPQSIHMRCDEMVPWFHRSFATDRTSQVVLQFDYQEDVDRAGSGLNVLLYASSTGYGTSIQFSRNSGLRVNTNPDWDHVGGSVQTLAGSVPNDVRYTVTMTGEQLSSTSARVTVKVVDTTDSKVVVNSVSVVIPIDGDRVGFKANAATLHNIWYIDNIAVTIAAPNPDVDDVVTYTSYVYTFVNDFGQESPPSPPSDTVQHNEDATTTIITPTTVPSGISDDYGIVAKRIYRSATGSAGSEFLFVVEIPLDQAVYVDTVADSSLGEPLESTDWDLPPANLRFILALPNGIMVGAAGNQLCLSERNHPHAWPVAYRMPTDTDITGLGNVDTSVVIGTKSFVYTASGNDPQSYSMSKPGAPHACQQHRSIAYLLRIGVVFAGPDGLMAVNGPTDVTNLTESIYTREQWQALNPETILGIAHDDIYFFWHGDPPNGGFALDMKQDGFGLIELDMHCSAVAQDYARDTMVLCLDAYVEPTGSLLPPVTPPIADGKTLYEWNQPAAPLMRYSWKGKLWLNPHPMALHWARVRAEDYTSLEVEFRADGALLLTRLVTSNEPFRLPLLKVYDRIEWRAIGTSRVRTVEVADDVIELV